MERDAAIADAVITEHGVAERGEQRLEQFALAHAA